jgi:hypothetical protein
VLSPTSKAFSPHTTNLDWFTDCLKLSLKDYWFDFSPPQLQLQALREHHTFDDVWDDVTRIDVPTNMVFAVISGSRYPTLTNRSLDSRTANCISADVVASGLMPTAYHDPVSITD